MVTTRRKPGVVRDAIMDALRKGEAHLDDIHSAVEKELGSGVPRSSVRSYLRLNEGKQFTRTGRGRYKLRG
jgi:hypothetical protein